VRVLIVAGYFPPPAPLAATRVASLARFLRARGHDVRVIAARNATRFHSLVPDLPAGTVFYERKPDLDGPARLLVRARGRARSLARGRRVGSPAAPAAATASTGARSSAARLYDALVKFPDEHAGWLPWAVARGRRLVREWRPDVIYASAPPVSGLVAAAWLARRTRTPWVAELRDPWSDNAYLDAPAWRRRVDRALERRVLRSATALVSVTRGWAEELAATYGRPTALVMNGYDADAYGDGGAGDPADPERLTIRYTGVVYGGRRDPSPLFEALALAGAAPDRFRVQFYGEELDAVRALARRHGVEGVVEVHPPVARAAVVALQQSADVLLLLGWRSERDRAVVPGKLFEYLGARRPILHVGFERGEAAELVRSLGAGVVANDPATIAEQLHRWRRLKAERGALPGPPLDAVRPFSREARFLELETFLRTTLAAPPSRAP
jgi:glycosyltransferase involved in cell wall biosynthesis